MGTLVVLWLLAIILLPAWLLYALVRVLVIVAVIGARRWRARR